MKQALFPRLGEALYICILLAGLLVGQRMLNLDSDVGRHLTLGRYMLESGQIPTTDILSFTRAGEARPPYEWLSQVAFALAERAMGIDGVVLLTASVIAAAFLVVFNDALQRGGRVLISLGIAIWAAAASSLHWLTRPHVFSFLFLAIWLLLMERLRRGDRQTAWQIPVVMLLWSNFHGGFVFGFVIWIAHLIGWTIQRREPGSAPGGGARLLLVGAASIGTSMLTPGLGGNWAAVLRNSSPFIRSTTAETLPVALVTPGTWPFLGLVILGLVLGIRCARRWVAADAVIMLGMAGLGLGIMRNIPLFCLAAVPILAVWERNGPRPIAGFLRLESRISAIDSSRKGYLWVPLAILFSCAGLAAHGIRAQRGLYAFDSQRFPVNAVDWVTQHGLLDPTFSDLNWGGYLLYRLWPERRVFIDSQSDFYGEQFIREYAAMYDASGDWATDLRRHGISSIILPPAAPLASQILDDSNWTVAYQDSTAVVLARRKP
jgi:hypothetical protein